MATEINCDYNLVLNHVYIKYYQTWQFKLYVLQNELE